MDRRTFLKSSILWGGATLLSSRPALAALAGPVTPTPTPSPKAQVAFVKTRDRAAGVRQALELLEFSGVKGKRLFPKKPRLALRFFGHGLAVVRHPLNPTSPRLDIRSGRVVQPRMFTLRELDLHLGRQHQSDFVLDSEDVVHGPVVTLGPEVRTILGVDQLRRDPNAVAALTNAAFKHVSHAKSLGRLADIDRASPENEGGIARGNAQARQLRQGRDNVLDQTIAKIVLLGIAAHVLEWQHRDGGFVGKRPQWRSRA